MGAVSAVARKNEYTVTFTINDTEESLLIHLAVEERLAGTAVTLSARGISQSLNITEQTARRTWHSLPRKGRITVRAKTRRHGSRAASGYLITLMGWKALEYKSVPLPERLPEEHRD